MLPIDRVHAIADDIGKRIEPIPVMDKVKENDVAPIITIVSTDFNIVFRVIFFIFLFGFMVFIFEVCDQFFNVVNWDIKTVYII